MNRKFFPSSLAAAAVLLIAPLSSNATVCTFDVDASSGIGTGSFTVDLPESWPANLGQTTLIRASSFHGFLGHGDKWTSISIALNEFIEQPSNAILSGTSRRLPTFKVATAGVGINPVEAVDGIPGVTRRSLSVTRSGISRYQPGAPCAQTDHTLRGFRFFSSANAGRDGGRVLPAAVVFFRVSRILFAH